MNRIALILALVSLCVVACGEGESLDAPAVETTRALSTVSTTTTAPTTTSSTTTTSTTVASTRTALSFGPPELSLPTELAPIGELVVGLEADEETGELEGQQLEIDMAFVRGSGAHEMLDRLDAAHEAIALYLEANPDDVDALILSARLGRLRIVLQPHVEVHGGAEMPDLPEPIAEAPLHEALTRVLELDPARADAAYWQARLYGIAPAFGETDLGRLGQAIDYAQLAVELEPNNAGYRLAAAIFLYRAGRIDQATTTVAELIPDHPLAVWLETVAVPPLPPENAILNEVASDDLGAMLQSSPDVWLTWHRDYAVPASLAEIEEHYRRIIPGFVFLGCETSEFEGTEQTECRQNVTPAADGFDAADNEGDIPDDLVSGDFMFVVIEMRGFDAADAPHEMGLPVDLPDPFSSLFIWNALVEVMEASDSADSSPSDVHGADSAEEEETSTEVRMIDSAEYSLSVGECIDEDQTDAYLMGEDYSTTPCDELHDNEVFLVYEWSEGPYPGDAEVVDELDAVCLDEFEGYVGTAYEVSSLDFWSLLPEVTLWEQGERFGECLLYDMDEAKLIGSARNSGW